MSRHAKKNWNNNQTVLHSTFNSAFIHYNNRLLLLCFYISFSFAYIFNPLRKQFFFCVVEAIDIAVLVLIFAYNRSAPLFFLNSLIEEYNMGIEKTPEEICISIKIFCITINILWIQCSWKDVFAFVLLFHRFSYTFM